ncbi:hypothetical protein [uncultured Jannaschia sp.]|uniref:hypothetical protein n=1 Tax=uncultured Jannaschia sp. TaxID=293347 RepID=UPI002621E41E|nr:hypothetical protein [uncultured Jannaschia sp.]
MRYFAFALLLALPAHAQDTPPDEGSSMERGLRLFMDGLREEVEPALRGFRGLAEEARPYLEELQRNLGDVVEDVDAYEAPEILENGDILIRRKDPLTVDPEPEATPDGSVDL